MTRPIRHLVVLAAIFGGLSVTASCGQKGPLYLPDDAKKIDVEETAAPQEQDTTKKNSGGSGY